MLTERQQKAQALAYELGKMGAMVVSLPGDSFELRFQIADSQAERILAQLREWGWSPTLRGVVPQFHGMPPVSSYQIVLQERQPLTASVEANRAIPNDLSSGKKDENSEASKIAKDLGYR